MRRLLVILALWPAACGHRAIPTDGRATDTQSDGGLLRDISRGDSAWIDTPCGRARQGGDESEVCVPAGTFVRGTDPGEGVWQASTPKRVITLSAFFIDRYEVTRRRYLRCVAAGACAKTTMPVRPDNVPIGFARWPDALAFCAWDGRRLPTDAEWEKAARGGCEMDGTPGCGPTDERPWPWGWDPPSCELRNSSDDVKCGGGYAPVTAKPKGASPYHILAMGGNVEEWVSDYYGTTYYGTSPNVDPQGPLPSNRHILRGAFYFRALTAKHAVLVGSPGFVLGGIRCARSATR
ncbi:MAG: SUMF1/EgtB/PvdO family nonheme iron enzyme [Deltaproteobacteria bacterium]|nr:SUMF1/EgtB/PvdO family nonheme iron enzyme [Deltaproteobacteria bacterium]